MTVEIDHLTPAELVELNGEKRRGGGQDSGPTGYADNVIVRDDAGTDLPHAAKSPNGTRLRW